MTILRPYQKDAVQSVLYYWEKGGGNPLVEMATGTGKSLVISHLVKHLVEDYGARVLMLTHVKELVAQNVQAMLRAWPSCPLGINSASLGRRDRRSQVLFASIQSVAREDLYSIGQRDVLIIDEAHLMPHAGDGQYRTLINRFKNTNCDLRVAGFTATPYRMGRGLLYGKDCPFDDLIYSYGITDGVRDGFLSPLRSMSGGKEIDVRGIGSKGGDFIGSALEGRAIDPEILNASCEDMARRLSDKKSCLVFCSGIKHADMVKDYLGHLGETAECVTGLTQPSQRDGILARFKRGEIKYLTNANLLTTGFDAPIVDSIVMMRPTLSTGLYVQMLGRGTRLYPGKTHALVLDYSGNVRRHGPVDAIEIRSRRIDNKKQKAKEDDVNSKECPGCACLIDKIVEKCPECGHEFKRQSSVISKIADTMGGVLKSEIEEQWIPVDRMKGSEHISKSGNPCLKISYRCGLPEYAEYLLMEDNGYAGKRAFAWWKAMTGEDVPLKDFESQIINACVNRLKDIHIKNMFIKIKYKDGFKQVVSRKFCKECHVIEVGENLRPVIVDES